MAEKRARTKSRRPWRKRIILASIGLFLGLLVVLFFSWVYNPFGRKLEDPLVLIPTDVDFLLSVEDLPGLLEQVENGGFIASLRKDPGLEGFLRDPAGYAWLRDLNRALKDGLEGLKEKPELPFGLEPITDLSGKRLTLGAYLPEKDGDPWPFFAVIQPESWLGIAGANVLINRRLGPLFVDGELKSQNVSAERSRDSIRLDLPSLGRSLFVTRIADAILISSEERQLGRIRTAIATEGIPSEAALRFRSLLPGFGGEAREGLWLLARRSAANKLLDLENRLRENWGPDDYDLVRRILPRPGGEDVLLKAELGSGLDLSVVTRPGAPYPGDLFPGFAPHPQDALSDFVNDVTSRLPAGAFAAAYLEATVRNLVTAAQEPGGHPDSKFRSEPLLDKDTRELLDDGLKSSSVGDFDGLIGLIDRCVEPRIGMVFFRQPRPLLSDEAQAGYLIAWPLRDRVPLDDFLAEIERGAGDEGSALVRFERETHGSVELIRPGLKDGIIDDPRVNQPGLAIVNGRYLLYSNFHPYLQRIAQARPETSFGESRAVQAALGYLPDSLRAATILDWSALDGYCKQSTAGWATQQTTPDPVDLVRWRGFAQQQALRSGLSVGSPRFEQFVNADIQRKLAAELKRRPQLQRKFDTTWRRLRTLLSGLSLSVEAREGLHTLSLHFAVPEPGRKPAGK